MKLKRFGAYLLDYAIVILVASCIASLSVINPYIDKYNEVYEEYEELVGEMDVSTSLDYLEDEEFASTYQDLVKYGSITSIITVVCYLLYFVGFQKWNKDQTVGKKIFGIKVTSTKGNTKAYQYLFRMLLVYNLIPMVLNVCLSFILDSTTFLTVSLLIEFVFYTIYIVCICMILFRKDNKGLHDVISNTEVILA